MTDARRWAAFAVLLTGGFLAPLDFFIVNVGLPAIRAELGATPPQIQLVMSGYAASYAVFLITGGRLGDLFGRRRMFVLGMAAFVLTSVMCGLAPSASVLVIGRVLEGVAGAVMAPQVLASIRGLWSEQQALGRALSLFSASIGFAAVAGQLLGGVLVAADVLGLGWRVIFLLNLPIGVVAIGLALLLVPETSGTARPRLDLGGAALLSLALACLVVPLSEGPARGWPGWSVAMLVAAPPLLAGFLAWEVRVATRGGMPLLDPGLLRVQSFRRGALLALLFFATAGFYLLFSIYQQSGLGVGALWTGLAILPYGVGLFLGPLATAPLLRRFGGWLFAIGMAVEVVGYAGVGVCAALDLPGWPMTLLLFIGGFGQGIALPRLFAMVLADVPATLAGLASGVVNSMLQIGAALSQTGNGSLFFAILGGRSGEAAYAHAFSVAVFTVTAELALALLLSLVPVRRGAVAVAGAGTATGAAPDH